MRLQATICLAALLASGCAVSEGRRDAPGWFSARGADLMDVFGVRVAVGAGLGAYVRATEYLQLGAVKKGPGERDLPAPKGGEPRSMPCVVFGTIGRYGGLWYEESTEVMLPGWSNRDVARSAESSPAIQRINVAGYVSERGEYDNWRGSFGLGAHLLIVGAEAELRPFEVIDFFAGIVGYDPSGDDLPPEDVEASLPPVDDAAVDSATNS